MAEASTEGAGGEGVLCEGLSLSEALAQSLKVQHLSSPRNLSAESRSSAAQQHSQLSWVLLVAHFIQNPLRVSHQSASTYYLVQSA